MKKNTIYEYSLITLATFLIACAVYYFLIPSNVVVGSIAGLSMILHQILPLPISTITLFLNCLLLLLGFLLIGKEFSFKTIYTSIALPFFIGIFENLAPITHSITGFAFYDVMADILLAALGQAILFHVNASSGGLDIVAKILNKYTHIEIGLAVSISGFVCSILSIVVYDLGTLVISLMATLANGLLIDVFINGFNRKKKISIICDTPKPIEEYILNTLKRGVTRYPIQGGYSTIERTELVTIVSVNEYKQFVNYLHSYPEKIFVTVSNVNEILGEWH